MTFEDTIVNFASQLYEHCIASIFLRGEEKLLYSPELTYEKIWEKSLCYTQGNGLEGKPQHLWNADRKISHQCFFRMCKDELT